MALVPNIPNNRPLFQPSHIVTQHVGNMSGFNYSILPLQFNLQRGTRYKKSNRFTKCSCKVYPGEEVYGICPYDNKKHTGRIIRLYYDPTIDPGKEPKVIYAYIQDKIDNEISKRRVIDSLIQGASIRLHQSILVVTKRGCAYLTHPLFGINIKRTQEVLIRSS